MPNQLKCAANAAIKEALAHEPHAIVVIQFRAKRAPDGTLDLDTSIMNLATGPGVSATLAEFMVRASLVQLSMVNDGDADLQVHHSCH